MNVSSINYNNNKASNNNILSSNNDDLIIINNNLNYSQVTNEKSELSEISNPITFNDGNNYKSNYSNHKGKSRGHNNNSNNNSWIRQINPFFIKRVLNYSI